MTVRTFLNDSRTAVIPQTPLIPAKAGIQLPKWQQLRMWDEARSRWLRAFPATTQDLPLDLDI